MAGLREKQKADRQQRILDAAMQLFQHAGYAATRMEDIAEQSELSVGTLYNYFETKGDLLLALVTLEVQEVLAPGASVVQSPPGDVAQAMNALIGVYYAHSLVYLSKPMWRTAMALTIEAPDTPFSQRFTALDHSLVGQVTELVVQLQHLGLVNRAVPAAPLGAILFNDLNQKFIEFIKSTHMTVDELMADMASHTAALARLLAPAA